MNMKEKKKKIVDMWPVIVRSILIDAQVTAEGFCEAV